MRVTTIGTGTAAPRPERVQSAVLLEAGDVRLLVDCGSGVVIRMAQLGLDWSALTHVALTHFHSDHCADLPTLVFAWRYGMLPSRTEPVSILGPPGICDMLSHFDQVFALPLSSDELRLETMELAARTPIELATGVVLECVRVPHTASSVAYSLTAGSLRTVVSGDTGFDSAFAEWARGADVLVLECSLPASMTIPIHLTPEQCAEVAEISQPGMLVLTHFYPSVEAVDIPAIIRSRYAGPVVLAHDGWSTTLGG